MDHSLSATLDVARLRRALPDRRVAYAARMGSTNDEARRLAGEGAPDGTAVLADEQTAGRGRRGARWVSPAGRNLMVSVLRRPDPALLPPERWSRLTLAAALAGTDALDGTPGLLARAEVKWPNDLYLSGKKAAGILVESAMDSTAAGHVVIGTGVNLNLTPADFPEELRDTATSVWIETGGRPVDRTAFAIAFLSALERRCRQAVHDFPEMLREAWDRSWLAGKNIRLLRAGEELEGIAAGLGPEGELRLRAEDGRVLSIASADLVRVVRD
ncbi:MAG: biotin--[acetyl-CoA-carboxylase] ligase [Verrucomicrobiales bacterium]|nr:biotin--[acetyl-CoA-carboxylase] ligase [Verrucomicrobiales bacterium]